MTTPRSILLVGNYPPPFGGVPKHLAELVPSLVAAGWAVDVLSPGHGVTEHGSGFTVHRDDRGSLGRVLAPVPVWLRARRSGYAGRFARLRGLLPLRSWLRAVSLFGLAEHVLRRRAPDVVGAYNLLFNAPAGALIAEASGAPLVITNFGEIYSHRAEMLAHRRFIEHLAGTATLTTLSHHCARSYREIGLSPAVQVLPYGVDVDRFAAAARDRSVRASLGIAGEDRVALFVGRFTLDMGADTVLAAAPRILASARGALLVLIGADGPLRAQAQRAAAESGGRLRVAVDVPEGDLPRYVAAADVVLAPTRGARACGSLASAEAMAAGRPVVAANVGGIPEIVIHGECGVLVPPDDATALARAVAGLLADPTAAAALGRRGAQLARERFDGRQTNAAIERLFRRVADRAHPPPAERSDDR